MLNQCNGSGSIFFNDGEKKYSVYGQMKKAALLSRSIRKGEICTAEDFVFKRTGTATDLSQLAVSGSVGQSFSRDLDIGHVLTLSDFMNL